MPKQLNNMKKHNPNLLKQFMRHYPDLAREKKYDVDSEDEDYTDTVTKLEKVKPQFEKNNKIREKTKYKAKDIQQVFS